MLIYTQSIPSLFSVKDRWILVTGGAGGLGSMMSAALVQNGANVIIASRKEKDLQAEAERLNKTGKGRCHYVAADLGSKAGCDALAAEVKRTTSKLHALVNNSGSTWGAKWEEVPEIEGWDRVFNLNVKALFYLTVALTELLSKDATNLDPGRVINIASVAGLDAKAEGTLLSPPETGLWSYNSSKAAALNLTLTQAVSLGPRNIIVNAVCPGVFPSRMTGWALKKSEEKLRHEMPLGRLGNTEDMAGLILFLCSRASAHISGAAIPIDGGALIAGKGYSSPSAAGKL